MSVGRREWIGRWIVAAAVAGLLMACHGPDATDTAAGTANLDFTVQDMNGQTVRLADFKGHPMLINFWATWCPPCKAEIPWFVDLAAKYRDRGLVVLGVSVDDTPEAIRAFAADYHVDYPMLVGNGHDDLIAAYEAQMVVPVSWLIRPDGTILTKAEGIHPKEWFESQIQAIVPASY
jgi:cytochrome c biogenesis protein CcmG/thiol:disulfide interchange protein DsbE